MAATKQQTLSQKKKASSRSAQLERLILYGMTAVMLVSLAYLFVHDSRDTKNIPLPDTREQIDSLHQEQPIDGLDQPSESE